MMMKMVTKLKCIFIVFAFGLIIEVFGDSNFVKLAISDTKEMLATTKKATDQLKHLVNSPNPGEAFSHLGKVLGAIGPIGMGISAALSIVTMFLPKEDSPELKAIKKGFEEVNTKVDDITSKIGRLENLIQLSAAKATIVKTVTAIDALYGYLEEAKKFQDKKTYKNFIKQKDNNYDFAAAQLYDSLLGEGGPFGFNLIFLYKTEVECNPVKICNFCAMGISLINKALEIEGAYFGYHNLTAKVTSESQIWKGKMNKLSDHCTKIVTDCQNNWEEYAKLKFRESFNKKVSNNQEGAQILANDLSSIIPQRNWLAVYYDETGGFGHHTFIPHGHSDKIWREKGKCASIFSTEKHPSLQGNEYNNLVNLINAQKQVIGNIDDCNMKVNWLIDKNRYEGVHALTIVNKIKEKYNKGVIYAISLYIKPAHVATGGTLYASEQRWQCDGNFKLIIFE